jgi:hypothetical protein
MTLNIPCAVPPVFKNRSFLLRGRHRHRDCTGSRLMTLIA